MISLPNPQTKMQLNSAQYNHIVLQYVDLVVGGMTHEELYQYAYEQMEYCLREYYPNTDKLLAEIESVYDKELVEDLLETVNIDEDEYED
jgi:hypothetical protein